jgi:hypothetical protein
MTKKKSLITLTSGGPTTQGGLSILEPAQRRSFSGQFCGLYHKHITIVNDESSISNKVKTSLTDNAGVIIYDHHMFIVQAI